LGSEETVYREDRLIERCRAGDEQACEELVRQYQDRVFALIYRITGDAERVEDIAQEVFLRAFRSLKKFRGGSSFYTWLYRITVNTTLNALRASSRRQETSLEALDGLEGPVDPGADPVEAAAHRQVARRVKEAIDQLDEQYRAIVYLREIQGLSYEEIAEVVALPVGTVKSRLFRARQNLKELLKDLLSAPRHEEGSIL
jgi:RNA polymerase sigma-70 factor (ECF subfamily)